MKKTRQIIAIILLGISVTSCDSPFDYHYEGFDYSSKKNIETEINKLVNIEDKSQRFLKTIELEKTFVDEGVFLPAAITKHTLQKSRFYNPNYQSFVPDYKYLIPFDQFIKTEDREEANALDIGSREGLINFFTQKGYTSKTNIALYQGYYFDWYSYFINALLPTNNHGLYKIVNNVPEYDLIEDITQQGNVVTISIKDAYWKDYELNNIRKINADDFIYTYEIIKMKNKDIPFIYNDLLYDSYTFEHLTRMDKIDENTFSMTFDSEIDVGSNLNIYPINKEMIDKWMELQTEKLDYQYMVFADGDYSVDYSDNCYVIRTNNKDYLPEIKFYVASEENRDYPYSDSNDIIDITDINSDIASQYDDYLFGRNRIRNIFGFHLVSGSETTKVYNEAVKFKSFRKAMLTFLHNNIDLVLGNYYTPSYMNGVKIYNSTDRFEYHDFVLGDVSYRNSMNNYYKNMSLDIESAKQYFAQFKQEFGADIGKYPVELNFELQNGNYEEFAKRLKDTFGNYVKLIKIERSTDFISRPNYITTDTFYQLAGMSYSSPGCISINPTDEFKTMISWMYLF